MERATTVIVIKTKEGRWGDGRVPVGARELNDVARNG